MENTLKITKKYETYSEYKDSGVAWIGKIPKEWNVKKIKALFYLSEERSFQNGEESILSLTLRGIKQRDITDNEGQIAASYEGYKKIKKGDIVLNPMDLRRGFVDASPHDGIISPAYSVLRTKNDSIDSAFYNYYLQKHYNEGIFFPFGIGVSVDHRWTLKDDILLNFPIIDLPVDQQVKIAEFLDKKTALIDQIIEKKEKLIELFREKRTSVINQAVTKGLDSKVELVESGIDWIGKIPKGWNASSLKTLLQMKITDGPHTTPQLLDDGIRFISAESIQENNTIDFNKNRGFISQEDHVEFCKKAKPQRNDIFMVKSGATTGRVAIVETDSEFSIWSPLALIRTDKNKSLSKYTYYFLQSGLFQDQVRFSWSFGTQQNIGMRVIENLLILYPAVKDQKQIVEYLDTKMPNFDLAIQRVENSIKKLKEFKSSLISNVVTGKIKI